MKRLFFECMMMTLLLTDNLVAWNAGQVIRGTVFDKQSLLALPGANVVILGSNPPKGASTGDDVE